MEVASLHAKRKQRQDQRSRRMRDRLTVKFMRITTRNMSYFPYKSCYKAIISPSRSLLVAQPLVSLLEYDKKCTGLPLKSVQVGYTIQPLNDMIALSWEKSLKQWVRNRREWNKRTWVEWYTVKRSTCPVTSVSVPCVCDSTPFRKSHAYFGRSTSSCFLRRPCDERKDSKESRRREETCSVADVCGDSSQLFFFFFFFPHPPSLLLTSNAFATGNNTYTYTRVKFTHTWKILELWSLTPQLRSQLSRQQVFSLLLPSLNLHRHLFARSFYSVTVFSLHHLNTCIPHHTLQSYHQQRKIPSA